MRSRPPFTPTSTSRFHPTRFDQTRPPSSTTVQVQLETRRRKPPRKNHTPKHLQRPWGHPNTPLATEKGHDEPKRKHTGRPPTDPVTSDASGDRVPTIRAPAYSNQLAGDEAWKEFGELGRPSSEDPLLKLSILEVPMQLNSCTKKRQEVRIKEESTPLT